MAEKEIGIIVRAKDEASQKMGDIASNMKTHFSTVSVASAAAGAAITAFLGSTLSGAAESEAAQRQLEHAVLNVTHANQSQLESTMALADALEAKGVLDGDAIKVGLAQLSTFGLSNKAVQGLGQSMADLAVNQFGVNASTDQLSQTANVMAKALQGQFGVLEKSGIRFTEAQQKAIMFGKEMDKVKAINEGLAQNLKYTNDVALTTFEGGMAHLNVQIGNVTEAIGSALFPVLIQLSQQIMPVVQSILGWINANPSLFQQIVEIVGIAGVLMTVLGGIGIVIGPLTAGFQALAAALALIFSPVGLVVASIAALTAGLIYLYNTHEEFRNKVNEVWGAVLAYIPTAIETIKSAILGFITTVKTAWDTDWNGIRSKFEEVWQFLSTDGLAFATAVFVGIQEGIRITRDFIDDHWTQIQAVFDLAFAGIRLSWGIFWEGWQLTFNTMWELFMGAVRVALALFRGDTTGAWNQVKTTFTNIWNGIKSYFTDVLGLMGDSFRTIWNAINAFTGDILTKIQEKLITAWDNVKAGITSFGATIKGIWDGIWDGVARKVQEISETINSIVRKMTGLINDAINAITSLASKAGSMVGFGGFGGARALGGGVSSGSTYLVGERGPEMFVPDQQGSIIPTSRTGGGGGTIINNNFSGATFLGTPEEIGDAFMNVFRLQQRI